VLSFVQSNSVPSNPAQSNSAGSSNPFADGQTADHSSGGGFPGLLSLASGERTAISVGVPANGGSFRERLSTEQSSGPSDGLSPNRSSDDRSSDDSPAAGSAFLHFGSVGPGAKKGANSEKQPFDTSALAVWMNPLLAVPAVVPVPKAIPVSVPTSGSTSGSISTSGPGFASAQTNGTFHAGFQSDVLPTNGTHLAVASALTKQHDAKSGFSLSPNFAPEAASWISGVGDRSLTATDSLSIISFEARSDPKKSADLYAMQAATQVASGTPDQSSSANSVSPGSNPMLLPMADASAVYPALGFERTNSLPSDFQTTGDAAVAAAASPPSAATPIAAGADVESVPPATSGITSTPSQGSINASDHDPQAHRRSPAAAISTPLQIASQVPVITSAKSGTDPASAGHAHKTPVPQIASTAQGKPEKAAPPIASSNSPANFVEPLHHASQPGSTTQSTVVDAAGKPCAGNKNSGGKDFGNKDLLNKNLPSKDAPNKDQASKDLTNDPTKDLINKDLTNKDLINKDLISKDPNAQLLSNAPPVLSANSANPATNPSIDAFSVPSPTATQPAASSSSGASASLNPSSALPRPDTAIQQNAPSGSVQLARIADHAGQSEMHIGMRMPVFGSVEVHTSVHQSEVGITVGSEHGDLKTFLSAEIPALRDSLNQQNLQFSHLNFLGAGDGAGSSFGGDARGNSQSFIYKPNFTPPGFHSEVAAITDSGGLEGEILPASQIGLSIHA
jgi:hypothetical protein